MCPTSLLLKISCLLLLGSITYCNAQRVLTVAEQTLILGYHNAKRAAEGSSNIKVMVYDKTLAVEANGTASDTCPTSPSYSSGKNYFVFSGTKVDLNVAVNAWYKPKADYNYTTLTCADEKNCDTYLQVVASEIDHIGCAIYNCTADTTTNVTLVCVYGDASGPVSMVNTDVPYLKGAACSNCSSGTFYCTAAGLCDSSCKAASANCVCKVACKNCGTATIDCKCQCSPGWRGLDCSAGCNDTITTCGTLTSAKCKDPAYPWMPEFCTATCGVCAPSKCSPGFTYDATTGKCYLIAYQPLTRQAAQQKCVAYKSNLAFIETSAEQTAISTLWTTLFPAHDVIQMWIGLCRKNATYNDDAAFVWSPTCTQGTGPAPTGTTALTTGNWATDEPNNLGYDSAVKTSGEWCVEMYNSGSSDKWNDVPCASIRNFYICEQDPTCK